MSTTVNSTVAHPVSIHDSNGALGQEKPAKSAQNKNYKGFVGGVFSGIAKLSGKLYLLVLR
jgi:hypothetical protein